MRILAVVGAWVLFCMLQPVAAEMVHVSDLFADAEKNETLLVVDDGSRIDPLKPFDIISRDGTYRERHEILHVFDGRYVHLTKPLLRPFLSGAKIYQVD